MAAPRRIRPWIGPDFSLLWLAQALGSARLVGGLILAASSGAYNVSGSDQIRPENATITGPCKIIPLEFAHLQCRQIDLQAPSGPGDAIALAEVLYREASADRTQTLVAWRAGRRWLPTFEPIPIGSDEAGLGMLTDRGVYLVTGGLGGIGGSIAQHLAKSVSARLVLVGRTEYPAREQWATLAADASTPVDVARGIQKVLDLEAAGAEVLLIGADVCDAGQFRAALERAREHFGRIDGVIHAAGVPGMGLLQFKSADNAAIALGPKVNGTRVIMDCLAEHAPDFVVLFSSITSVTGGGPGQVDYCAANAYLDAVAQQMGRHGPRVLSIDWGEWRWNAWGAGLSGYAPEIQRFFEANRRRFGIGFDEGWSALLRALGSGQSQLVVSTQDFGELAELSRTFTVDTVLSLGQATHGRHDRPELSTSYVAPGSDVERLIATVWCDCLGLDKVGVNDNFFELGGNSLLGVDLIARICRELDREPLAPHVLYLAPSVAALAELVSGPDESAWVDERRERGALRRQNLRKRRAR